MRITCSSGQRTIFNRWLLCVKSVTPALIETKNILHISKHLFKVSYLKVILFKSYLISRFSFFLVNDFGVYLSSFYAFMSQHFRYRKDISA